MSFPNLKCHSINKIFVISNAIDLSQKSAVQLTIQQIFEWYATTTLFLLFHFILITLLCQHKENKSLPYTILGIVTDVSAILVATTILRVPRGTL